MIYGILDCKVEVKLKKFKVLFLFELSFEKVLYMFFLFKDGIYCLVIDRNNFFEIRVFSEDFKII